MSSRGNPLSYNTSPTLAIPIELHLSVAAAHSPPKSDFLHAPTAAQPGISAYKPLKVEVLQLLRYKIYAKFTRSSSITVSHDPSILQVSRLNVIGGDLNA